MILSPVWTPARMAAPSTERQKMIMKFYDDYESVIQCGGWLPERCYKVAKGVLSGF